MTVPSIIRANRFAVIDLEATGFSTKTDQIIQAAVACIDNGKHVLKFVYTMKPSVRIHPMAERVHGLSEDRLQYSPTFAEIGEQFRTLIGDRILLGYNILRFDRPMLKRHMAEVSIDLELDALDVFTWAKRLQPGVKGHKLGDNAERLGVKVLNAHDAWDDVRVTWGVFCQLAKRFPELGEASVLNIVNR